MSEHPLLEPLIAAFALEAEAVHCVTPRGAYANCLALSGRFAAWLRSRGVLCSMVRAAGYRGSLDTAAGRWPHADPRSFEHWITVVDGFAIDWTARQFDPEAAWPSVTPVADLRAAWEQVDCWSCAEVAGLVNDPVHLELAPPRMDVAHRRIARATAGAGPYPDPRHVDSAALMSLCGGACLAGVAAVAVAA
jgi:hypothetical protein